MAQSSKTSDKATKQIRWTARIIGSLIVAFWLFMSIGYAIVESEETWTWESSVMAILVFTSTIGFIIAWKRELIGGMILLICAVAHSTFAFFAAGHNRAFAMLISGGPYLLVGGLFLLSQRKSKDSGI